MLGARHARRRAGAARIRRPAPNGYRSTGWSYAIYAWIKPVSAGAICDTDSAGAAANAPVYAPDARLARDQPFGNVWFPQNKLLRACFPAKTSYHNITISPC